MSDEDTPREIPWWQRRHYLDEAYGGFLLRHALRGAPIDTMRLDAVWYAAGRDGFPTDIEADVMRQAERECWEARAIRA